MNETPALLRLHGVFRDWWMEQPPVPVGFAPLLTSSTDLDVRRNYAFMAPSLDVAELPPAGSALESLILPLDQDRLIVRGSVHVDDQVLHSYLIVQPGVTVAFRVLLRPVSGQFGRQLWNSLVEKTADVLEIVSRSPLPGSNKSLVVVSDCFNDVECWGLLQRTRQASSLLTGPFTQCHDAFARAVQVVEALEIEANTDEDDWMTEESPWLDVDQPHKFYVAGDFPECMVCGVPREDLIHVSLRH